VNPLQSAEGPKDVNKVMARFDWFHNAVRSGTQQPAQVLQAVRQECARRRHWRDETDAAVVLEALDTDPAGALAYAQSVLDYEQLPYEARQRVKAERAIHYLKQGMVGKPVTAPQAALLRTLGYQGTPPADRAEASRLIEALLHGKGGAS
jgi:hypothetical protein